MIEKKCLQLSRPALDALNLDHFLAHCQSILHRCVWALSYLLSIHHIIPPISILASYIACPQPPIFSNSLISSLFILPVALHNVWTTKPYLAALSARNLILVIVHQLDLTVRHWLANGAGHGR